MHTGACKGCLGVRIACGVIGIASTDYSAMEVTHTAVISVIQSAMMNAAISEPLADSV